MSGVKFNLNDSAIFRLTQSGQEVWRRHCKDLRKLMKPMSSSWKAQYSGEESEVKLQLWQFIQIFGGHQNWQMGGPYVLADMNIEILP